MHDPDIPVLDTERLTLRGHQTDDFADCVEMWGDPEVTRQLGARPSTPEEVWSRMLRYVGHWTLRGYGYWVIREKGSGRFVGEVGFADFQREIDPPLAGPEIGWALARWAHGRGFATEAALAALRWGDERLDARCTVCIIDPGNAASVRVAEKCGYRGAGWARYKGSPLRVFERVRGGEA